MSETLTQGLSDLHGEEGQITDAPLIEGDDFEPSDPLPEAFIETKMDLLFD